MMRWLRPTGATRASSSAWPELSTELQANWAAEFSVGIETARHRIDDGPSSRQIQAAACQVAAVSKMASVIEMLVIVWPGGTSKATMPRDLLPAGTSPASI